MTEVQGTYLYCVGYASKLQMFDGKWKSSAVGEENHPIRLLTVGEISAVVSDAEQVEFELSRKNLLAHQRVLDEAMEHADILPTAFGTVAQNDEAIFQQLLTYEYDTLRQNLDYITGRAEFSLSAEWLGNRLFEEIPEEYPDIGQLRDSLAGRPEDTTYFERIQLGQMIESALNDKQQREIAVILEALEPYSVEILLNDNLTDAMLFNASILVEHDSREQFDQAVDSIGEANQDRLAFRLTGPLPPASFTNVRISWESEVDGLTY